MNRTIKEATAKRFHYDTHDQLKHHLANFLSAYNFGQRLKTPKGFTPDEPSARPGHRSKRCRLIPAALSPDSRGIPGATAM